MFWNGLIVGIGVGVTAVIITARLSYKRVMGYSWKEGSYVNEITGAAARNRESTLAYIKDGEVIETFTFEEK